MAFGSALPARRRLMLHIHNGDSTAGTLREFGFAGEHRAFQEVLMEGPAPAGLSQGEWLGMRSRFLADAYESPLEKCLNDLRAQEQWLRRFPEYGETILWFEHDLFCQINLIYLLDWFSKQSRSKAKLSLVCIDKFPGKPDCRGLGELTGEQLASLFDSRHEVTEAELNIAATAWEAYCSAEPGEIVRLLDKDTSAMPFLGQALRLHLMRFPSSKNGLGRVENTALELLSDGATGFKSLFPRFLKTEPVYGMGDSQVWAVLKRLGDARNPLIAIAAPADSAAARKSTWYHDAAFELTETGRAVVAGERDFVEINGIDLWLGGVHLLDGLVWRWDERGGLLIRTE